MLIVLLWYLWPGLEDSGLGDWLLPQLLCPRHHDAVDPVLICGIVIVMAYLFVLVSSWVAKRASACPLAMAVYICTLCVSLWSLSELFICTSRDTSSLWFILEMLLKGTYTPAFTGRKWQDSPVTTKAVPWDITVLWSTGNQCPHWARVPNKSNLSKQTKKKVPHKYYLSAFLHILDTPSGDCFYNTNPSGDSFYHTNPSGD